MANTQPTNSKVIGASSSSSPILTSATPFSETEQITLPYGTVLAVRLAETLSSDFNRPGDTFLASLASPIVIGDRVIVPEGASVKGKIVDARNAKRFRGKSTLVVEVTQLTYNRRTYELSSSQYSKQGASRNPYAAAATTGGAGVGHYYRHRSWPRQGSCYRSRARGGRRHRRPSRDQTSVGRAFC